MILIIMKSAPSMEEEDCLTKELLPLRLEIHQTDVA